MVVVLRWGHKGFVFCEKLRKISNYNSFYLIVRWINLFHLYTKLIIWQLTDFTVVSKMQCLWNIGINDGSRHRNNRKIKTILNSFDFCAAPPKELPSWNKYLFLSRFKLNHKHYILFIYAKYIFDFFAIIFK